MYLNRKHYVTIVYLKKKNDSTDSPKVKITHIVVSIKNTTYYNCK